jgi:hypothetical protein
MHHLQPMQGSLACDRPALLFRGQIPNAGHFLQVTICAMPVVTAIAVQKSTLFLA